MRVPVNWLKEYVDFDETPAELATKLTMTGLEVEQIETEGVEAVLEIKVTPNRGDCLSIIGTAREVSAITGKPLKMPEISFKEEDLKTSDEISISIKDPDLCPRYTARLLTDIKIVPSPGWMQMRLLEAGMRPINNVVDVTNYVMLEMGQPLHSFDADLIAGKQIIVRRGKEDEKIRTLDGQDRDLGTDILMIADRDKSVAIAGIMGGENSEVTNNSTKILLESAHFDPVGNRHGSKVLGLSTEASYRYERHVDPEITQAALDRVTQLIQKTCSCKAYKSVDVRPEPRKVTEVTLSLAKNNKMLGIPFTAEDVSEKLQRLGFTAEIDGDSIKAGVPSWRPDITLEADLMEEVARLYGYDNLPTTLPVVPLSCGKDSLYSEIGDKVRWILSGLGIDEVMTHSLVNPNSLEIVEGGLKPVVIRTPLNVDHSVLRTSLLPNLLGVAKKNAAAGFEMVRVYEIGSLYGENTEEDTLEEWRELTGLLMGDIEPKGWHASKKPQIVDFFHVKGVVETLLSELGITDWKWEKSDNSMLHPGRAARLVINDEDFGMIGEVHPSLLEKFELPSRAYIFDLQFSKLAEMSTQREYSFTGLAKFPAITRDIAAVFSSEIPYDQIQKTIRTAGGELVEDVRLFDVYEGKGIPEGHRSLAYSVSLRASDRTLTDQEGIDAVEKIKKALTDQYQAGFRG